MNEQNRPSPAVFTRAHGVAPGADGQRAQAEYVPPPEPVREKRLQRLPRPAPAPPPNSVSDGVSVGASTQPLPAHQLVLADLYLKRQQIDAAINALEELYG